MSNVAQNIKQIIRSRGLMQKTVAKNSGFSEKQFSAMMTGRKLIRPDYILPIAKALDSTPNELYGLDGEQNSA